jgi:hypothetical protein
VLVFDRGDGCGWLVCIGLLRRGLGVVAAMVWLNVDGGFGFGIGLLVLGSRVLEPPLSFQDRQPHVRSFGA